MIHMDVIDSPLGTPKSKLFYILANSNGIVAGDDRTVFGILCHKMKIRTLTENVAFYKWLTKY